MKSLPMSSANTVQQINDAIGAHGMWKLRLRTAIRSGRGDITSHEAGCDDRCAFGKWLYGPEIDAPMKHDMPYQVVKRLHAEFHKSAGSVLAYVETGRKDEAQTIMEDEFPQRSEKLVRALTKWKGELLAGVPPRRVA